MHDHEQGSHLLLARPPYSIRRHNRKAPPSSCAHVLTAAYLRPPIKTSSSLYTAPVEHHFMPQVCRSQMPVLDNSVWCGPVLPRTAAFGQPYPPGLEGYSQYVVDGYITLLVTILELT